jgi:hypothetical protein
VRASNKEIQLTLTLCSRYGDMQQLTDLSSFPAAIQELVAELCQEQYPRPDYEHAEISISHDSDSSITATMPGLITLRELSETRYLYGLSPQELEQLLSAFATGDLATIHRHAWSTEIPQATRHAIYLFCSRPDISNLHKAAAAGDCQWIREEVSHGAVLNTHDRNGATPLHWAALAGQLDACRLLLALGADIAVTDNEGVSVQEYAEMAEEYLSPEEVQELIETLSPREM